MERESRRNAGFTFVELMVSTLLLGTVAASAVLLLTSTSRACASVSTAFELDEQAARTLESISRILRQTSADKVTPTGVAAPLSTSLLDLQRASGDLNGAVVWGDLERIEFEYDPADPDDGVDNDLDGFVDEGRVVHRIRPGAPDEIRIVLCRDVMEVLEGELPGNLVDDNGNGLEDEPGLCFDFEDGYVNVRITLGRRDVRGATTVRTLVKSVSFRNYGS